MLQDVGERDQAGVALGNVHPVPCPGIVDDVGLAAQPDPDAVDGVIEDGQKDEDPLQHAHQRQAVEELDLLAVGSGALERLEVREQVLEQKCADGDDAQQRMQLAPDETSCPDRRAAAGRRGGRWARLRVEQLPWMCWLLKAAGA